MEAAEIPTMDALAKAGLCGLHDPVQSSLACGSDAAHMSILGYTPLRLFKYEILLKVKWKGGFRNNGSRDPHGIR